MKQLLLSFQVEPYKPSRSVLYAHSPIKRPGSLRKYNLGQRNRPKGKVIYFLWNGDDLIYTGQTTRLAARLRRHRFNGKKFDTFSYERLDNYYERLLVGLFKPSTNVYLK